MKLRTFDASCEGQSIEDRTQAEEIVSSAPKLEHAGKGTSDLANLDLLRSFAVLLVLTGHLTAFMMIRGLGDLGHFGVLLFFVHTALVLMLSMERLHLSGGRLYAVFAVRRISRIYPLSVLAILFVVVFRVPSAPWLGGYVWTGWSGFIANILLIQNITQSGSVLCILWSLPFEIQMYLFLPLLYDLIRRFPSLRTPSLIWLAFIVASWLENVARITSDPNDLLLRYSPCFLAGVFAWRLMASRHRQVPGAIWVLALFFLAALYRLEDVVQVYGPNWLDALRGGFRTYQPTWRPASVYLVRDWLFCGITGLAIPFFADVENRCLNAIAKRVATYSYGIYVCHVPVMWFSFDLLHVGNRAASAVLALSLTALLSFALYHFIENPAIRFGKRISTQLVLNNALT